MTPIARRESAGSAEELAGPEAVVAAARLGVRPVREVRVVGRARKPTAVGRPGGIRERRDAEIRIEVLGHRPP